MPWSMMSRSSSGLTTVITASTEVAIRNTVRCIRYGRAYDAILRMVPGLSFCLVMEGSIRNPRIMTMFGRPYMIRETPGGGD